MCNRTRPRTLLPIKRKGHHARLHYAVRDAQRPCSDCDLGGIGLAEARPTRTTILRWHTKLPFRVWGQAMTKNTITTGILAAMLLLLFAAIPIALQGRKVTGVVVSAASGQPVANAHVLYEEDGLETTTLTDDKGVFEFATGTLGVLTVTAQGFGTAHRRWPPRTGAVLRVALTPPAAVQGTVADIVSSQPLPATVTIMVRHPANSLSDVVITENGSFRFDDLPLGPAVLLARSDGFAPSFGVVTVDPKEPADVDIRLPRHGIAAGRVVDHRRAPVSGASVTAWYSDPFDGSELLEGLIGGQLVTDSDGDFVVNTLVPDTPITLQAEFDGSASTTVTVTIAPGTIHSGILLRLP